MSRRSNVTRVRNVHVSDVAIVGEVLAAVCADAVRQVLTHRSKIAKTAPEELHEVRVGLRKLDTAIRLFSRSIPERKRELITKELRWLRGELSSARNLDVFSADILNPFVSQSESAPLCRCFIEPIAVNSIRRMREQRQPFVPRGFVG